jgi:hypothetical protein
MAKAYVVFDGRAEYDIDAATIVEYLGEVTRYQALKQFADYSEFDYVLIEFDVVGDTLKNPQRVYFRGEDHRLKCKIGD